MAPGDLLILHGRHTPQTVASVDKTFSYHTLQLMTQGSVELFFDERRLEMHGQWMWPCFPGPHIRFHEWPRGEPWDHRYVAFEGPAVARWDAMGIWPREPLALTPELAHWMASCFDELLGQLGRPGRWSTLRMANLIETLLLRWAELRAEPGPQRPAWLDRAMTALESVQGDEPDHAALARQCHLALPTFRRRFREATGVSPHQYYLQCRMAVARQWLGDSDLPIKVIAERLGYRDVFYFHRQFRQLVGVPPGRYRRSRQGGTHAPRGT